MKKKLLLILAALTLSALPLQAMATGNLSCNALGVQGSPEPVNVKVLWGQGPHGADLTLVSSVSSQMKFLSGYSPTFSNAGQTVYHAQLLTLGTGQAFGDIFISENSNHGAMNGKFILTQNGHNQSYGMTCIETSSMDPEPEPTPCHGRACF